MGKASAGVRARLSLKTTSRIPAAAAISPSAAGAAPGQRLTFARSRSSGVLYRRGRGAGGPVRQRGQVGAGASPLGSARPGRGSAPTVFTPTRERRTAEPVAAEAGCARLEGAEGGGGKK
jgi:hypothetical protein